MNTPLFTEDVREAQKEIARTTAYMVNYSHEYGLDWDHMFETAYEAATAFNKRFPKGTPYEDYWDWSNRVDQFMELWMNGDVDTSEYMKWNIV